jgi:hypothetical protein
MVLPFLPSFILPELGDFITVTFIIRIEFEALVVKVTQIARLTHW